MGSALKLDLASLIKHLDGIEAELAKVSVRGQAAFAAACVERQWPLVVTAYGSTGWRAQAASFFRETLDLTWAWAGGVGKRPTGLGDQGLRFLDRELEDEESTALREQLVNSFASLAIGVDGTHTAEFLEAPKNCLEVVTDFAETDTPDGLGPPEKAALIANEQRRQFDDVALLSEVPDLHEAVETLRERARRVELLGGATASA